MKSRSISKKMLLSMFTVLIGCTLIASAGLLVYYGTINTEANVKQSVLLDGKNWDEPVTHSLDITGGCRECFKHTIENQACVEAEIDVTTTIDSYGKGTEGVTVGIYDMSPVVYESDVITNIGGDEYTSYPWSVTIEHFENCDVRFTIVPPIEFVDMSQDNFAITFDTDMDGEADFQVSYHADAASHMPGWHWGYKEVVSGSWSDWQEVPSHWLTAYTPDDVEYIIVMSSDVLGNQNDKQDDCGLLYKFGVSGSYAGTGTNGHVNSGENTYFKYPAGFSWGTNWISSEDYATQTIGTEITSQGILQPGEEKMLCICYDFAINIKPGAYDITTKFIPVTE